MKPQQICKVLEKAIEIYRDGSMKMSDVIEKGDINQYRASRAFCRMDKSIELIEALKNKLSNNLTKR